MADIIRSDITETLFYLYIHIVILAVLDRLISSVNEIYNLHPIAKKRPIKGYVQFSKLVVYIVGLIIGVAILSGKPPFKIVTGLGALAAIVMLMKGDVGSKTTCGSTNLFKMVQYKMFLFA